MTHCTSLAFVLNWEERLVSLLRADLCAIPRTTRSEWKRTFIMLSLSFTTRAAFDRRRKTNPCFFLQTSEPPRTLRLKIAFYDLPGSNETIPTVSLRAFARARICHLCSAPR